MKSMATGLAPFVLALAYAASVGATEILRGADVSFLPQVEAQGVRFSSAGEERDTFELLRAHGVDAIRLRLWHSPPPGHGDLATTLHLAERAHDAGQQILLDLHYSDTWADPGHQALPAAWNGLPLGDLRDSVRTYTRDVLMTFAARGVTPSIVQLGNEITVGFLWPHGRVGGEFDNPAQWSQFASLLGAARQGVLDAFPGEPVPQTMIHIDRGGDESGSRWFFDHLIAEGVDFDLIGLSFYPWWHGSLSDLEATLRALADRYAKGLVVVETSYPWTLRWFDDTHNLVGLESQLLSGYPATPLGQLGFLSDLRGIVESTPNGLGRGVFWWAPEWVANCGDGSAGENLTLFDPEGHALPALRALSRGGSKD